ncbi:LOW QUALITY PROTEIN: complement component C9-like [Rhinoraja longicauda]
MSARRRGRLPWNINTFTFQTRARQQISTEVYETSSEMVNKLYWELTHTLRRDMPLVPYIKTMLELGIETILSYNPFRGKTHEYIRVKGQVELASFNLRTRHLELSGDFVLDLKELPVEYDKGAYFKILEEYGTHYATSGTLGGKYQIVYVLNKSELRRGSITAAHIKGCIIRGNSKKRPWESPNKSNLELCGLNGMPSEVTSQVESVIDDMVPLMVGGDSQFLTKLEAMLSEGRRPIDASVYVEWAASLARSPALLNPTLQPISALVPLTLPHSPRLRANLDRALGEYLAENDVCKCQPCRNGGTPTLFHGRCLCLCPPFFQGDACQTPQTSQGRPAELSCKGEDKARLRRGVPGSGGRGGSAAQPPPHSA